MDLEERATAFPGGGWLTRRNLEGEIPTYGPRALTAQQNAMADAVRRSQESGKRRDIAFTSARTEREGRDSGRERDRYDRNRDRDEHRDRDRDDRAGLHRPKNGWAGAERRRNR